MNPFEINPYIRVAIPSVLKKGRVIGPRIIFDYELIYIEKGLLNLDYGAEKYQCRPGTFLFLRPGVTHCFSIMEELSQPHIHFDMIFQPNSPNVPISFKNKDQLTPEEQKMIRPDLFAEYPPTPLLQFADRERAFELFRGVICDAKASPLLQKARLTEILDLLIQDHFPGFFHLGERNSVAGQIKSYLDAGQGLWHSLADLEQQFSYSRFHLERQFKKEYGISLIAYRNKKRMELAKERLKSTSVSEVAEEMGYSSIFAFSRAFKNYFGHNPSKEKSGSL